MKQKPLLILAVAIVCFGIGYLLRQPFSHSSHTSASAQKPITNRSIRVTARDKPSEKNRPDGFLTEILEGRSPQKLSLEELVQILAQLTQDPYHDTQIDRTRKIYQLQLILSKLSSSQLMMLADASTIDMDIRSIIITAFATKAPHQALEWAQGKAELSTVLATIGSHNPQLAAQYCREIHEQGNPQSIDLSVTIFNISEALAKSGAKALLDFSQSMPIHSRFSILSSYLTQVPDEEQAMVLDGISELQETNSVHARQVFTMFSQYARTNPELAKAWLASLPPSTSRDNLDIAMAKSLNANAKPNEARDQLARAIRSNAGEELKLLNRIALNDVEILPAFSAALPESVELKASDLQQKANIILSNYSDGGPTGIVDIAIALKGKDQQAELLSTALNQVVDRIQSSSGFNIQLNENDFVTLQSRIEALGLIDQNAEQVQQALEAAHRAVIAPKN